MTLIQASAVFVKGIEKCANACKKLTLIVFGQKSEYEKSEHFMQC